MKISFLNDEFFDRLDSLFISLRPDLTGYYGGRHLIKKYGQTIEFADYRKYEPGDDIRRIDWNLFARLKKYFLKLYTDERQMYVRIYVDCSASMGLYPQKAEYALGFAAALGYLAVRNNDKVSFGFLKNGTSVDPFGLIVGKNSFFAAISELEKITFGGEADLAGIIPRIPDAGENDGLSVIISDLLNENRWQKAVDYLLYKKRQTLVCQILAREDLAPSFKGRLELVDCEGCGQGDARNVNINISRPVLESYRREIAAYICELEQICASKGAAFMSVGTDVPIERAVFGLSARNLIR